MRQIDIGLLWNTSGVGERHKQGMVQNPSGEWGKTLKTVLAKLGNGCLIGLVGNRGNGKTQLGAHAVWDSLQTFTEKTNGGPPRACRAMDFFLDVRACFRPNATQAERDAIRVYIGPCLLVVDEMHERGETPWEDRLLTYLIDTRYAEMRDTILIANQTPEAFIKQLGPSIVDRMRETGGMIECKWPSFRGK